MENIQVDLQDVEGQAGVIWWNSISEDERRMWLAFADSAVPFDAWCAYLQDKHV